MRQRITLLHRPGDAVDPASLTVTDDHLVGPEANVARELRVTFALEELPEELASILRASHELHIRWASPDAFEALSPLHSRVPPGLHVFYTPQRADDLESDALCNLLRKVFESVDCSTPKASFVSLPNDRFSHSAAFQFYWPLDNLAGAFRYVRDGLCPKNDALCRVHVDRLAAGPGPVSLDVSYDTISHALKATVLSPFGSQPLDETAHPGGHRTEIGILGEDAPETLEPYDLGMSGYLVVLGQHKSPSPTMFGFPSRHRRHPGGLEQGGGGSVPRSDSHFSASFISPTGLHPTLRLRLSSRRPPPTPDPNAHCAPHAYFTLPRTIFADRYQLSDSLLLASKNLTALRYSTSPVDLEAPDYAVSQWGSAVLVELAPPKISRDDGREKDGEWTAEIPLHLRYLAPAAGGLGSIDVPYPAVFWACAAEDGTKFPNNPFERANIGYDGLFGPRTVFWHVEPTSESGTRLLTRIDVPVLDLDKAGWVGPGTAAVVLLGFVWVAWKLVSVVFTPGKAPVETAKNKKTQ